MHKQTVLAALAAFACTAALAPGACQQHGPPTL